MPVTATQAGESPILELGEGQYKLHFTSTDKENFVLELQEGNATYQNDAYWEDGRPVIIRAKGSPRVVIVDGPGHFRMNVLSYTADITMTETALTS